MSPLVMGSRRAPAPTGDSLSAQSAALQEALRTGGDELDPRGVELARAVVDKAAERVGLASDHTVVALAGATGSGKSSLFNALAGRPLAPTSARRPTTSTATAAVWGPEPAGPLLDWVGVGTRHEVSPGGVSPETPYDGSSPRPVVRLGSVGSLDGLVLLDLPDFDSREASHRVEAERVLDLCDVFVWVTDPQKYADAVLHEDYVQRLRAHDAVMVVVLNQVDRLDPESAEACRADLLRLLAADGVEVSQVYLTSATAGDGIPELRQRLADAVAGHAAARLRLAADLGAAAASLRRGVADRETSLDEGAPPALVQALARAAGVPVVLDAVAADYRRQSTARAGWVFTRWGRHLRPDPLARLRLNKAVDLAAGVSDSDLRAVLGRSSLPVATPAARSAVRLATGQLVEQAGAGLPPRWARAVDRASMGDEDRMGESLDSAIVHTSLRARDPGWWRLFGVLQALLGLAAVAGLLWLVAIGVGGWLLQLHLDPPRLGLLPYPTLLLGGGLVLGLLLAGLARGAGRRGAVRRRRVIGERLERSIREVAQEQLVAPTRDILHRHAMTRTELEKAMGTARRR